MLPVLVSMSMPLGEGQAGGRGCLAARCVQSLYVQQERPQQVCITPLTLRVEPAVTACVWRVKTNLRQKRSSSRVFSIMLTASDSIFVISAELGSLPVVSVYARDLRFSSDRKSETY